MAPSKSATLESLHEEASSFYLEGDFAQALAAWRKMLALDPSDERALEGARLCEMLTREEAPEQDEPAVEDPLQIDLSGLPEADDEPQVRPEAAVPSAARTDRTPEPTPAEAELAHRATELMADAMQCYERGDREGALTVLSRLQILDENHEAAGQFAAHIRAELEAAAASAAADASAAPTPDEDAGAIDDALNHVPIDLGGQVEGDAIALHRRPAAAPLESDLIEAEPAEAPKRRERPAARPPAEPGAAPGRFAALGGLARWGAVALVLAAVGGAAWFIFGPAPSSSDVPVVEPRATRSKAPAPPSGAAKGARGSQSAPAAAPGPEAVGELMSEARAAVEQERFADAIVAFDQVLKVDPANDEARRGLDAAGERYRTQKQAAEQRATAIRAFQQGDYREALRLFYRLAPERPEDERTIERWRFNGWFNMAVDALRAGDCATARAHVKEAKAIDPSDPDLKQASQLAKLCGESGRSQDYFDQAQRFPMRALDD